MSKSVIEVRIGDKVYVETIENNIELSELTPDEVMNALNRAVGKYAFYGALRADAKRMESKIQADYKQWEAEKFNAVRANPDFAKATVKVLDAQVILQNDKPWRQWQKAQRNITLAIDKLWVLVQSFELMTKTLQSILAMQRVELSNASQSGFARGTGDLLED